LRAIVAIHNLNRGPAIGGCRIVHYQSADDAIEDALRLGYMMSYKAAISNLPHGGAKAVIMKPKVIKDRRALLLAFGDFVNELGGRYITAMDSGTSESDMDIIAERTKFVTCTSASGSGGDPSPITAYGVCRGIEAAVKYKLKRNDLQGVHVSIQGAGHVGYYLAKELHQRGARMTMCDINAKSLERCVNEFGVNVCSVDDIYDVEADVFAPCALGSVLNLRTIQRLKVKIVAGSANNQLAHQHYGVLLHEHGILYAPDFVVNSGGLIYVAAMYDHGRFDQANKQVSDIYDTLFPIFERSEIDNLATNEVAEKIALEKIKHPGN
jgi:leucine dehydrogenase